MKIYLVRHGQTDWNAEVRMQGQTDIPLNQVGLAQAQQVAQTIAGRVLDGLKIDAIYSSDLSRAHDTAKAIAERLNMSVVLDERLREQGKGDLEGVEISTLGRVGEFGDKILIEKWWSDFKRSPEKFNAESGQSLFIRSKSFLDGVKKSGIQGVVVVSHGGTMAMLQYAVLNDVFEIENFLTVDIARFIKNCDIVELDY